MEGMIHIPEGMPLMHFLRSKGFFLNLTSATVQADQTDEGPIHHLSVRLSNVVWVVPLEKTLHVSSGTGLIESPRPVELRLVDDLRLTVSLNIASEQRMSDYLDANSGFVPLFDAKIESSSRVIERLAVNHEAIMAIREVFQE